MSELTGSGWTASVEHVSYALTAKGMSYMLEQQQLNVPVIDTPEKFRAFIEKTNPISPSIAVFSSEALERGSLLGADSLYHPAGFQARFFTIVYDKQLDSDTLYVYDSDGLRPDASCFQAYFSSNFNLYYPERVRASENSYTDFVYVLHDVEQLLQLQVQAKASENFVSQTLNNVNDLFGFFPSTPSTSALVPTLTKAKTFQLDERFNCDAMTHKKEILLSLVCSAEPELLNENIHEEEDEVVASYQ